MGTHSMISRKIRIFPGFCVLFASKHLCVALWAIPWMFHENTILLWCDFRETLWCLFGTIVCKIIMLWPTRAFSQFIFPCNMSMKHAQKRLKAARTDFSWERYTLNLKNHTKHFSNSHKSSKRHSIQKVLYILMFCGELSKQFLPQSLNTFIEQREKNASWVQTANRVLNLTFTKKDWSIQKELRRQRKRIVFGENPAREIIIAQKKRSSKI